MKFRLSHCAVVAMAVMVVSFLGCGSDGDTGDTGATGPTGSAMPVIQSLSATGLPAIPGGTVTVTVDAQSPEGLTLTYAWTVTGWTIASGQGTDTVDITAPATYGASGSAQVSVTDTEGRTGVGLISLSTEGNSAPIIHSISAYPNPANRGGQIFIDAYVTDPNGDTISYAWTIPTGFTLLSGAGTSSIVIQPTAFTSGAVSLTADDGAGGSTLCAIGVSAIDNGAWGSASLIETDNAGSAIYPQVAFDSSGNALAVWHQSDGTRTNIWANRYTSGSGWGSAVLIETDNGVAYYPQVAINSSGNAPAVWYQRDGTRLSIYANRYTSGSGWGTAVLIETDNAGDAQRPQVAIDSSGNATSVWYQSDGTRENIWSNRYTSGTGWGTAVLIETDNAGDAEYPQVAIDSSGNATAVWQQSDGTRNNIRANHYTSVSGWGTPVLIETDNGDGYRPQVAIDSSGNATAVWHQYGTRSNIWANRYTSGTGWGTAVLIETDNAGDAYRPQVAIDSSGNAAAVWYQRDGTRNNIWSNRYTSGTGWGTAVLIETDNAGDAEYPQVAMDSSGNAIALWQQWDGTRYNILANRCPSGAGWGTAEIIETDNLGDASSPQVAFDSTGNAMAVWHQSDGTPANIWANVFK
jgi:hypothetical protein